MTLPLSIKISSGHLLSLRFVPGILLLGTRVISRKVRGTELDQVLFNREFGRFLDGTYDRVRFHVHQKRKGQPVYGRREGLHDYS